MEMVRYTSLHSIHPEVEPLHVPVGVQIRSKDKLIFLWATVGKPSGWSVCG